VVAARALYAADAATFYQTIRGQAADTQRDLGSFETQVSLNWLRRELTAAATRALAAIEAIRQDALQHQAVRLHAYLKAEWAKRDRYTRTVSAVRSFDERDASESEAKPGTVAVRQVPAAKIVVVPPPGHPDRDRLLAEAMAAREAQNAE
jgi:hypothetical protein